jgi:hypothetical protein
MWKRNRLGDHLARGEYEYTEGLMKPFPVFTSADSQRVPVAAFKKHKIEQPAARSSALKDRQTGSSSAKGKAKRAAESPWDFKSIGSDDRSDSDDADEAPTERKLAPPKIMSVKPLASRMPPPGAWREQPIHVSDDSDGSQPADAGTSGGKRKHAEQVPRRGRVLRTPAVTPDEDDEGSDEDNDDGVEPDLQPEVETPPVRKFPLRAPRLSMRLKKTTTVTT